MHNITGTLMSEDRPIARIKISCAPLSPKMSGMRVVVDIMIMLVFSELDNQIGDGSRSRKAGTREAEDTPRRGTAPASVQF